MRPAAGTGIMKHSSSPNVLHFTCIMIIPATLRSYPSNELAVRYSPIASSTSGERIMELWKPSTFLEQRLPGYLSCMKMSSPARKR